MSLYQEWLEAKEAERAAVEKRRQIEDQLAEQLRIDPNAEGTNSIERGQYKVKVTSRLTRKVDADKLQAIAAEHGLSQHLSDLFRWKPEINMKLWQAADSSITIPLAQAITTKPGRPSFSIETVEE